jgi:hypothetical protein
MNTTKPTSINSIEDFETYLESKGYKSYLTIEIPKDGYYADLRNQKVDLNDFTQINLPIPSKSGKSFFTTKEHGNDFARIGLADTSNLDILLRSNDIPYIYSTQYDALTKSSFTVKIVGPSFAQKIEGEGWFIIPGSGNLVSFSKAKKDCCLGDIASDIIPDYSNEDYIRDYGARQLGGDSGTVEEYCRKNLRIRKPQII